MLDLNFSCMSHRKKKDLLAASLPNERAAREVILDTKNYDRKTLRLSLTRNSTARDHIAV